MDPYKVPAFKRKRSLAAKARKSSVTKKITRRKKTTPKTIEEISIPTATDNMFEEELQKMRDMKTRALKKVREMKLCGHCDGYFEKIDVAIIKVTSAFRTGDRLIFEKQDGLFEQQIDSMQKDRKDITLARSGDDIGTKVAMKPKVGTPIYKVLE